jgi:predicted nuclease with RNAse H fold
MNTGVFIGVDLGTSVKRKSTGIASIVERHGRPWIHNKPEHVISDDALIHAVIAGMKTEQVTCIVAIDAPLSRPDHGSMRDCEKRLRKHGIPCYPSGADWVSDWVEKGIELKNWSEEAFGARVIEVYPYAARRALNIGAGVKKKSKTGRQIIQEGLSAIIGGIGEMTRDTLLSDDELDAIFSAYTAYCVSRGVFRKMDGKDGGIYIPNIQVLRTLNNYQPDG